MAATHARACPFAHEAVASRREVSVVVVGGWGGAHTHRSIALHPVDCRPHRMSPSTGNSTPGRLSHEEAAPTRGDCASLERARDLGVGSRGKSQRIYSLAAKFESFVVARTHTASGA